MKKQNWRKELDLLVEENLNELIKETKEYDYAIKKSKDKSKAQIWIALALINNKINQILVTNKEYEKKIPSKELDNILDTLEKL
ncbi:MAG: hypothetical protein ACOC16_02635 [Nanoarchaeota archaeon]